MNWSPNKKTNTILRRACLDFVMNFYVTYYNSSQIVKYLDIKIIILRRQRRSLLQAQQITENNHFKWVLGSTLLLHYFASDSLSCTLLQIANIRLNTCINVNWRLDACDHLQQPNACCISAVIWMERPTDVNNSQGLTRDVFIFL
jgi:hypothetical protein